MNLIRHRGHRGRRNYLVVLVSCISLFSVSIVSFALGCSVPNLEKPQCRAARDAVKRFYSFHIGTEMHPSPGNLKAREDFLTSELISSLSISTEKARDYFTATENYPKAFRVGECTSESDDKVLLQVLLLWRDDTKNEQKEVKVEAVKTADKWLISKVFN